MYRHIHVRGSHTAFTGESPRYTALVMFAKASITINIAYGCVFENPLILKPRIIVQFLHTLWYAYTAHYINFILSIVRTYCTLGNAHLFVHKLVTQAWLIVSQTKKKLMRWNNNKLLRTATKIDVCVDESLCEGVKGYSQL